MDTNSIRFHYDCLQSRPYCNRKWIRFQYDHIYDFIYESGWLARPERRRGLPTRVWPACLPRSWPAARFVNEIVSGISLVGWVFSDTISFTNRAGRPAPKRPRQPEKGPRPGQVPLARFVNEIVNEIVSGKPSPLRGFHLRFRLRIHLRIGLAGPARGRSPYSPIRK